jgi:hypothetical protein
MPPNLLDLSFRAYSLSLPSNSGMISCRSGAWYSFGAEIANRLLIGWVSFIVCPEDEAAAADTAHRK